MDEPLFFSALAHAVRHADRQLDHVRALLAGCPPSVFTADRTNCLLQIACENSPKLALWMLERGAAPTPRQCSWCLLRMSPLCDEATCEILARTLLRSGADADFTVQDMTPLVICCYGSGDRRFPMARALLEMPDVCLDEPGSGRGAEDIADQVGNRSTAALIRETRTQQARWGRLRRAWVFAVVGVTRRPLPK